MVSRARERRYPGIVGIRLAIVLAVAGGCSFRIDAGGVVDDARPEVIPDVADAPAELCLSWTPRHFTPCDVGAPMPGPDLASPQAPYTYDTTTLGGVLTDKDGVVVLSSPVVVTQPDATEVAVLNVEELVVPAGVTIRVVGPKPLLVASWSTIEIAGTLDAGSTTAEVDNTNNAHIDGPVRTGAGANPAGCGAAVGNAGAAGVSSGGSGGGGGGALRGGGGGGAIGDTSMRPGGPGGTAVASTPVTIRGGCAGGASGVAGPAAVQAPATSASVSVGGRGGGALELAARQAITLQASALVNAGGAGGAGAPYGSACGGGGGGSGGYVGLDAPMVTVAGTIAANGGGGGGSSPYAGEGNQGANASDAQQAAGGAVHGGATCGLAGAAGAAGGTLSGISATGNDSCGGGGGGGGAGFVLVWSPAFDKTGATVSPMELIDPP